MPRRCCRDSVVMAIMQADPYEGQVVECRWGMICDEGQAIYRHGDWVFSDALSRRIEHMASPEQTAWRAKRSREILGR